MSWSQGRKLPVPSSEGHTSSPRPLQARPGSPEWIRWVWGLFTHEQRIGVCQGAEKSIYEGPVIDKSKLQITGSLPPSTDSRLVKSSDSALLVTLSPQGLVGPVTSF